MDGDRFDTLTRSFTASGSRRRALALALSGALAPLLGPWETEAHETLKKCKQKSGKQKKTCLKKAKKHSATHTTEAPPTLLPPSPAACVPDCGGKDCGDDGCGGSCGPCNFGTCTNGACVCPSVCPACQTCDTRTGRCEIEVSQNDQAGNGCAPPKVCCNGSCCDPVHECNAAGVCATCAEVCAANCTYCFNLTDSSTMCGDDGGASNPCQPCTTSDDCSTAPYIHCLDTYTVRGTNQPGLLCGRRGVCVRIVPCA